ncbi:hypothetical protein XENOCAPTIV_008960, partial [Xenoophorus captivus]
TGVSVFSLHPGVVQSDLWRHQHQCIQVAVKIFRIFTKTTVEGAQTTIFCAETSKPAGGDVNNNLYKVKEEHVPRMRCVKFQKIAMATAIGFAIMGFIGFFVKLIHIPINNIIV